MKRIKVAVIGLGFFGMRHARLYARHPAAELVAVCDLDPRLRAEAERLTGATAHEGYDAILADPAIDAISICLPDRLHVDAAVAAARAGKTILLEKPMAHSTPAARRIADAVEASGVRLMVGHILRFDPRYVQVHAAAAPERLGEVIHMRAKRHGIRSTAARLGDRSSILFYMGVHDVDAMQWVARSRIARVYAQKRQVLGNGNEDALQAIVNFESGAIGIIDYSWAWPDGLMNGYRATLEVVGTKSATYLDCADQGFYTVTDQVMQGGDTHLWPEVNGRIAGDLADEIDHFVLATRDGAPYLQDWREAFDAIPVLDALARSATTGERTDVAR
ncbi:MULTISPECIES: Gfo/Idh/MocA family oxidoreductase [unclassified Roseitalea]|uniref:Gfo/Idh/MocA family protein n=1 Tax=unclassified Roseitalea TaxID=2639107 RepID=UPI00273F85C2|nr:MULTISPECIES: Gfo/Idh/MocA family oxidoreductase [unclassified Roseitalea]